jgi:hypothetical protein
MNDESIPYRVPLSASLRNFLKYQHKLFFIIYVNWENMQTYYKYLN